jgi:hypothetical protein
MLARTYLEARKLGLTVKERDALIKILGMLEGGVFIHEWLYQPFESGYAVGLAFNMGDFCGTTGCIAGWSDLLCGTKFMERHCDGDAWRPGRRRNLQDVFYVNDDGESLELDFEYDVITPKQAAQALRNYLTLGKPYWQDVLEQEEQGRGQADSEDATEPAEERLCVAG